MNKPKNRRKTYRYFANFDFLEFEGESYIRFPNERQHHHLTKEQSHRLGTELMAEAKRMRESAVKYYVDGSDSPVVFYYDGDIREFATRTAKMMLLTDQSRQKV